MPLTSVAAPLAASSDLIKRRTTTCTVTMMWKPEKIIIHHSGTNDSGSVSWGAIRQHHLFVNKWSRMGYHFGIELLRHDYEVLVGLIPTQPGIHCIGHNENSIGICMIGDFNRIEPPQKQWNLGLDWTRFLCNFLDIPAENVYGHGELDRNRTCPGTFFDMSLFRRML